MCAALALSSLTFLPLASTAAFGQVAHEQRAAPDSTRACAEASQQARALLAEVAAARAAKDVATARAKIAAASKALLDLPVDQRSKECIDPLFEVGKVARELGDV